MNSPWTNTHEIAWKKVRSAILAKMPGHPIVQQYVALHDSAESHQTPHFNTQAWHALGEQYITICQLALGSYHCLSDESPWAIPSITAMVIESKAYLWRDRMREEANTLSLPRHTIAREQMPYPVMFWSFESALDIYNEEGVKDGAKEGINNWMLIADKGDHFTIVNDIFRGPDLKSTELQVVNVHYGQVFPTDFNPTTSKLVGLILKLLAFLNSPYITKEEELIPRSMRRRIAKVSSSSSSSSSSLLDPSVIVLRRSIQPDQSENLAHTQPIEHHFRWTVSGHIRAQWYPSLNGHKLIWIASHVKGPPGLPLKETVYDVRR